MSESSFESRYACGREFADHPTPAHALPGDRAVWPRDRVVDIVHIKIDIRLDVPNKSVSGTATHTVAPLNDGTRWLELDAVDMEISAVTVARQPAPFDYDGRTVRIDLGPNRKRGMD